MTPIQDKFDFLLQSGLNLGAPVGIEETLPDGGSKQVYQAGAIYFHPRIGTAFECHGLILESYLQLGEQRSALGYPLSMNQTTHMFSLAASITSKEGRSPSTLRLA